MWFRQILLGILLLGFLPAAFQCDLQALEWAEGTECESQFEETKTGFGGEPNAHPIDEEIDIRVINLPLSTFIHVTCAFRDSWLSIVRKSHPTRGPTSSI